MHIPVLLNETIALLKIERGDTVVDATLGGGGHAKEIVRLIGETGRLVAFDVDPYAISTFKKNCDQQSGQVILVNNNFHQLSGCLDEVGISEVDAILADLGWRSDQVEDPRYGLSFMVDGPLDMRLGGQEGQITAAEIVNQWTKEQLSEIFWRYGEEKKSTRIAQAIIEARRKNGIRTTTELAKIVEKAVGGRRGKIHPATRVFQALRITVNNELETIERFLPQALSRLRRGGRLAIITFHSLEDRVVKHYFKSNAGGCVCPKEFPLCVCGQKPGLKIITKKAVTAGAEELAKNPRARSAKLRVIEKL